MIFPRKSSAFISVGSAILFFAYASQVFAALEPVVLVPGIMGTKLSRASDGVEVWPDTLRMANPFTLSDGYLDELILDSQGHQTSSPMVPPNLIQREGVGINSTAFYGPILDILQFAGYASGTTLFTVPYDWRLDLNENIGRLSGVIQTALSHSTTTGKVNVIAHSMGGVLTKAYLATSTGNAAFINKLILAGVPQLGAPLAFKALNYGDDMGFRIKPSWGNGIFYQILNPFEAKKIVQNMPGVYELLPSRRYFDATGSGYVKSFSGGTSAVFDYDQTNAFMVSNPENSRNSYLLERADVFHSVLDANPLNATNVYNIMGCAYSSTPGRFFVYDNGKMKMGTIVGDGTVPLESARYQSTGFTRNYFALSSANSKNDHLGLIRDPAPTLLIQNILNNQPDDLPLSISSSSDVCVPLVPSKSIVFMSHGKTTLQVFDSQNRHLGPGSADPNDDIEFGIPNAFYQTIGENRFAFVPASGTYRVVIKAQSPGGNLHSVSENIDFEAQLLDGATNTNLTTYLDVLLPGASTTIYGTFTTPTSSPILDLDADGNGVPDGIVNPTSILIGTSTQDITPPTLTMPQIANPVVRFSTTTLVFSAVDTESGLLRASGTIDGVAVQSGQVVSFPTLGEHVFRFEAKDLAGNPVAQEIRFFVGLQADFRAIADTFVDSSNPNANYGNGGVVKVLGDSGKKMLVYFSSSSAMTTLASSTILSASLELDISGNNGGWGPSSTLQVHRMRRDWNEYGVTWNCANDLDLKNNNPDCFEDGWNMANSTSSGSHPWIEPATSAAFVTNAMSGKIAFAVVGDIEHLLLGDNSEEVGPRPWSWLIGKTDGSIPGLVEFFSHETRRSPWLRVIYLPQ